MKTLPAALAASTVCLALVGCSTHRKELESKAPPQNYPAQSTRELTQVTIALLRAEAPNAGSLPSEALAPLTDAATITFIATGSRRVSALVRRFANALLVGRVKASGEAGIPAASLANARRAQIAAVAGTALFDAYAALRKPRYRAVALADTTAVISPALGWVSRGHKAGVRADPTQGPNIAMTANAVVLLERAAALGRPRLNSKAQAALRTIYTSQAAVGRWYANVGSRFPMSIGEWATTLYGLSADGSKLSIGILGAGVPGLYQNAFDARGRLSSSARAEGPTNVALAMRALAAYEDISLPDKAFRELSKHRRHNGTITLASSSDSVSQAYFALAFALRLASLTPTK